MPDLSTVSLSPALSPDNRPEVTPSIAADSIAVDPGAQVLPAGGPDPDRFDWSEVWYPVHYLADLDRDRPTAFTLLGRPIVLWWDRQESRWRAFIDRCPHRLVPLSEGRITEDGLLECPYHGWAFTGTGQCDRIPQEASDGRAHTAKRACATALATQEAQGLLFVYAGQPDLADRVPVPQIMPPITDPGDWTWLDIMRDLPYDAVTLLENILDASHVPFTHHRSLSNRANAAPLDLELQQSDRSGFAGVWPEGPRRGTLGSQFTTYVAPALIWHDLQSEKVGRTVTAVYATPIEPGRCRLFARFPFKFPETAKLPRFFLKNTPRWYSHFGQHTILEDDQIFLHYQEHFLADVTNAAYGQACYLPTKADLYIVEFRAWLDRFGEPFPRRALPPVQNREALLDRYHSHTVHCRSCSQALKRIQTLKRLAIAIAALAWSIGPIVAVTGGTLAIVAGLMATAIAVVAAWFGLDRLERQFYDGRLIPPRNLA